MNVLEVEDSKLEIPTDFSFPGTAYSIQKEFMEALFSALDNRALGIFESPTGTGKSLSLLCGSLAWLERREEQRVLDLKSAIGAFDEKEEDKKSSEAVDWVAAQYELRKKKNQICKAKRELKFIEDLREKRTKLLRNVVRIENKSAGRFVPKVADKKKIAPSETAAAVDEDSILFNDDFAPDFDSDSEWSDDENDADKEEPEFFPLKNAESKSTLGKHISCSWDNVYMEESAEIIFASRTHSQLSQFVNELKKSDFASRVTSATLGSRQNMCINPEVNRLKSVALINERCLDLQKKSKGKKTSETKKLKGCGGCQFFNHSGIEELKRHILNKPLDIEDLVTTSKKDFKACPYYASRKAAKEAQIIMLPYNTILHSGTREAIGLRVENSVVLLDEAHNIIESISNMYSTSVTESQLEECCKGLKTYIARYMSRFNSKNLLQLKQIEFVLKSFYNYLKKSELTKQSVFQTRQFKSEVGIEELDLFELSKFITKSRLIYKLRGYIQLQEKQVKQNIEKVASKEKKEQVSTVIKKSNPGQSVLNVSAFIKSLVSSGPNGRIIQDGKTLKFLLLDPAEDFSALVTGARSIILAGGTMKPYDEIEDQLFHSARQRISHFSCNHVIPKENLVCMALSHGPTSHSLDFTFKNRNSPLLLEELSRVVMNTGRIIPGGLIIFLPSYDYENKFYTFLNESGSLKKIEQKKKVFREPKDSSTDKILAEYTRQIRNNSDGAILLAVVGGKLSEGINFADDLGRCVIVVGLPYPNITSVEIKEKINFMTNKFGSEKAKMFLQNACFKAVNQSIGRSIRHFKDYSAIILLDHRFLTKDSQSHLPGWIFKSYTACSKFGQCFSNLAKFFSSKNNSVPSS